MSAKPSVRWVAVNAKNHEAQMVDAPTWFLARQAAAVLLRADPCDIDVRRST